MLTHLGSGVDPEGGFGELSPLKIIKNVKKILKLIEKPRLPLKFSQEIRTETSISNFNLKGNLVRKIYVWGDIWGDMFRIIHMKGGMCSALYTVKCTVGGDIWRGYVPHYIPEGGRKIQMSEYKRVSTTRLSTFILPILNTT